MNLSIVQYMTVPMPRRLSAQQEKTLYLLSKGLPQAEIAKELGVCVGSVKARKVAIIEIIGLAEYRRRVYVNG